MKPAPFVYHKPATLAEALELLARYGSDAKPLAGGQSLIPAMNFRLARPAALVDLAGVAELAWHRATHEVGLSVGAMTRQRALERDPVVAAALPLLAEALPHVAHPQIRNRGTLGGSIAHADPAAELPAVMLALNARFKARSLSGERWIAPDEFNTGLFATALAPGELLVEIEVPKIAPRTGVSFLEVARRHGDYALAGVAAVLTLDGAGRCVSARIALFSVGDGPMLAVEAAAALAGEVVGLEVARAAAEAARQAVDPPADIHASAAYRRQLVATLVRRAVVIAAERARAAGPA